MANTITHLYFGKQVIKVLPKDIREKIVEPNKDAFMYGTIGPDFLFSLREIKDKSARYCNIMQYSHQYEVFSSIAKYLSSSKNDKELSHALGLMCHYVLDYRVHPYVNFFVEEVLGKDIPEDQQMGIHSMIESAIDEYLITNRMGFKEGNDYNPYVDLKTSRKTKNAIASLYINAINDIIKLYPSRFKIKISMFMTNFVLRIFTDKSGKKRAKFSKSEANSLNGKKTVRNLMRPPELYGEVDYLNLNKIPFRKVRNQDEMINHTAIELIDECIAECVQMINELMAGINGKELDKDKFRVNFEGVATF